MWPSSVPKENRSGLLGSTTSPRTSPPGGPVFRQSFEYRAGSDGESLAATTGIDGMIRPTSSKTSARGRYVLIQFIVIHPGFTSQAERRRSPRNISLEQIEGFLFNTSPRPRRASMMQVI